MLPLFPVITYVKNVSFRKGLLMRVLCFIGKRCPNCPPVKDYLESAAGGRVRVEWVDCGEADGLQAAREYGVSSTPTAIVYGDGGEELGRAHDVRSLKTLLAPDGLDAEGCLRTGGRGDAGCVGCSI